MKTLIKTVSAYTAAELRKQHPEGFVAACEAMRVRNWECGYAEDRVEDYLNQHLIDLGAPHAAVVKWDGYWGTAEIAGAFPLTDEEKAARYLAGLSALDAVEVGDHRRDWVSDSYLSRFGWVEVLDTDDDTTETQETLHEAMLDGVLARLNKVERELGRLAREIVDDIDSESELLADMQDAEENGALWTADGTLVWEEEYEDAL